MSSTQRTGTEVRDTVDELRAGTRSVRINGMGPFNVRERRERANYAGEYVDTTVELIGENRRIRLLAKDKGTRGAGTPVVYEIDPEGNRISDAERVDSITLPETITSDVTVLDYIDSVQ
ncbi:hypothetical protein SAMN04487948_12571 [Halogranum amylolyticum]|uniref:Uncharacterized protein n=1 Tax=Halogranum amylolyticum TaxID=660520 RepID=A0A1H8W979_9EURY|nr:hypothetical protein [Halogranum amylolyticum]SEP24190.1 hypothetical protein SAMN04487948_12571 [Halogranum amylolyticum]